MAAVTVSSVVPSGNEEAKKEYEASIASWQATRQASCASVDGMLALAGLHWWTPDINTRTETNTGITIGSDASCEYQLPAGAPAVLGTLYTRGLNVAIVIHPSLVEGKDYKIDNARAEAWPLSDDNKLAWPAGSIALSSDGELPAPITNVYIGGAPTWPIAWTVVKRDYKRKLAIRVRDKASPALKQFTGLTYFPTTPSFYVPATFQPYDEPRSVKYDNAFGFTDTYAAPGVVAFELADGVKRTLEVIELPWDAKNWLVSYRDATLSKKETYGIRYLFVAKATRDAPATVIDFNRTQNPPCAFTAFIACSLPPRHNWLPIRVEAGERRYQTTMAQKEPGVVFETAAAAATA